MTMLETPVETEAPAPAFDPAALMREARDRQRRRRRRLWVAFALAAGLAGLGYGIDRGLSSGPGAAPCPGESCSAAAAADPAGKGSATLYGFARAYAGSSLFSMVDPTTLKPVGKELSVPEAFGQPRLSPDGKHLVLVSARVPGGRDRGEPVLALVQLPSMRFDSAIQPRLDADLAGMTILDDAWNGSRQLVVVAARIGVTRPWRPISEELVAIDPASGAREWSRSVNAALSPAGIGVVRGEVILLLEGRTAKVRGRGRVLAVSSTGQIRSSSLSLLARGNGFAPGELVVTSSNAYVVAPLGRVFAIDPGTARTTLHRVATPRGAPTTSPPFPFLNASPVGANIVATNLFGSPDGWARAGIYLIDTSTWTARLLDPTTPAWFTTGGSLVTFTESGQFRLPSSWTTKGTGVRIYDANGNLRSHLYGTQAFERALVSPGFAAVDLPAVQPRTPEPTLPAQFRAWYAALRFDELVFDPATGKSLGTRVQVGYPPELIRRGPPNRYR
jgi:hypothetical protein